MDAAAASLPAWIDAVAKLLGVIGALGFFLYKWRTGYHKINLELSIACERVPMDADREHLSITATLKKGDRGSLRLHDLQARVTTDADGAVVLPFIGFERLSYERPSRRTTHGRRLVQWSIDPDTPFIAIPPGDATQFACTTTVPRDAACTVEVVVLGVKQGDKLSKAQWRASVVSLPHGDGHTGGLATSAPAGESAIQPVLLRIGRWIGSRR